MALSAHSKKIPISAMSEKFFAIVMHTKGAYRTNAPKELLITNLHSLLGHFCSIPTGGTLTNKICLRTNAEF